MAPKYMSMGTGRSLILFDGVCNFCNSSVNFIIDHDKQDVFRFTPLQSEIGQELTREYDIDTDLVDSVILYEGGKTYTYSTAALRIAKQLGAPWSLAYGFIIIPEALRDFFYKLFAKNRYRLFGKKDSCMIPTPEVRAKFLN